MGRLWPRLEKRVQIHDMFGWLSLYKEQRRIKSKN